MQFGPGHNERFIRLEAVDRQRNIAQLLRRRAGAPKRIGVAHREVTQLAWTSLAQGVAYHERGIAGPHFDQPGLFKRERGLRSRAFGNPKGTRNLGAGEGA